MTNFSILLGIFGALGWLYLAIFHGLFWHPLFLKPEQDPTSWPSLDVIIPARNEAKVIPQTLASLLRQDYPGTWSIIFVDDHSDDETGKIAQKISTDQNLSQKLSVVTAPDLPLGWSGKVAAMQAGVMNSRADYILFTDADIEHPPNSLRILVAEAVQKNLDLTSLMVKLNCQSTAEKLLIPAFVFFFAMLYPFRRANNDQSRIAAAAGGVMLVRRKALNNIGGLARIKSALIDDCSLAKAIKRSGGEHETPGHIQLTLTRDVKSLRIYPKLGDIWHMIGRTAFTQLRYSVFLLLGTVMGMGLLFGAPLFIILFGSLGATALGLLTLIIMMTIYLPMIRFYNLPPIITITLPIAGVIYIGATLDSARLHWQGRGGQWKGRNQT